MRNFVFALGLAASLSLPSHAQETQPKPVAADIATLDRCLKDAGDNPHRCIAIISNECQKAPDGSTTPGIAACHEREAEVWDRLLNERYKALMASTAGQEGNASEGERDPDAVAKLRDAQRKWVAFRDAECDRIYAYYVGGTIRTPAYAYCELELTAERAIDLAPEEQ